MKNEQAGQPCENVFIGLGSNLGDSQQLLLKAWKLLGEQRELTTAELSSPYLSSPVGMSSSHWFVNAVGRVVARCSPQRMLDILQHTEACLGRLRNQEQKGYQDRIIDLDLIYFGNVVGDDPRLTLPHPQRADRLFVLAPLSAIAADFVDPELASGYTVSQLYQDLLRRIEDKQLANQEILELAWPVER